MRFDHLQLPNGLTLIGEYNEAAQSLAVGFFVRTGSRDETPEVSGVSHFLEHMMFKGTARRSADDINREFDEIGAKYNAFTSEENTVYYGAVLPPYQSRVIDLLADMMRPALRPEDFEVEKKVILEEIALYQDRPEFLVFDMARETYFNGHPLGNRVLGTTESISALTREQMLRYWEQRYAPNNMVVALTGCYDWEAAVQQLEELCGSWEPRETPRSLEEPSPGSQRKTVSNERFQQAHLCWVLPGFAAQDERRREAQVLAQALGDEQGSRLYWALVYPGLAETAAMFHMAEDGTGLYFLYVCCSPERVEQVEEEVQRVLAKAREEGLGPEEIQRAKRKMASGYMLRGETPFGRLVPTGFNWLYRREHCPIEEEVDRILALPEERVEARAKMLPAEPPTFVALIPHR